MSTKKIILFFSLVFLLGNCSGKTCPFSNSKKTDTQTRPEYLFVQEGGSGTFTPNDNGTYSLRIEKVVPYTIYFSDRPEKIVGNRELKKFIDGFCWDEKNPPNAAIVIREANKNEDTLIVQLMNPKYNPAANTLSYTTKILPKYDGTGLAYYHTRADNAIPAAFKQVSLFIDDCANGIIKVQMPNGNKTTIPGEAPCCFNTGYPVCKFCNDDEWLQDYVKNRFDECKTGQCVVTVHCTETDTD